MRRRMQRARHARWTLVFTLLGIVALHAGLVVACQWMPRLRDPLYGDKVRLLAKRSESTPPPLRVVMLGSSRTGFGFHALHIEPKLNADPAQPVVAFNFGIPASGPVTHRLYFERMVREKIAPDLLLLEILPSMLFIDPNNKGPLERLWFYGDRIRFQELDILEGYGLSRAEYSDRWRQTLTNPWYALRFQLLARLSPGWVPFMVRYDWSRTGDACGWGTPMATSLTPAEYAKNFAQAQREYGAILASLDPGGAALEAVRDTLRLAKQEGIAVRIVLMPEGKDFQAMYPPHVWQRVEACLTDLHNEFGYPIINARDWVSPDGFTDGHHMMRHGAKQFSDRMADDVILPWLQER